METALATVACLLSVTVVYAIAYYEGHKNGRIDAYIEMLGVAGRTLGETDKQKGGGAE